VQLLEQLASGDPETWNEAFRCLYPVAFEAARTRLGDGLSGDCEDIAMETLSDILEKGVQINSEKELKPLTAAIARNKATDHLRRHLAEKRGGNKAQSLEEMVEANAGEPPDLPYGDFVDGLAMQELRDLLADLSAEVKKEYRVVLRDHFFDQLSYNEIAEKRKISVGSVGVYVQRGLTSLRNVIARKPKLQGEFMAMLSDAGVVRVLLPLASAIQLGGWFFDHMIQASLGEIDESKFSDLDRLRMARESQDQRALGETQRSTLFDKVKQKYPQRFQQWKHRQEEARRRDEEMRRRWKYKEKRNRVIGLLLLVGVIVGLLYGIIRLLQQWFG
jgi:RNA polymerase sigma factor (sigma-70 family)